MDLDLAGRTYIVTGGTRGLGRATAEVLANEGASLVISSRSRDSVEQAAAELGQNCVGIVADNADADAGHKLCSAAVEHFGGIDGALISVGGPPAGRTSHVTESQWRDSFESVFLGAIRMANSVAEHLKPGGSIAFILSSSVKMPIEGLAISNGLRPGLAMIAKTLADELGPQGIRVNGLLPGRLDTDRVRELDDAAPDPAAAREKNSSSIPLRRYGEPEEFARVATFILSPAASYLTGAMIPIDGGLSRSL